MTAPDTRIERDSMGEMEVPSQAYYGASTQRAALNFPISGLRFPRPFIRALGLIKQSAAQVNAGLSLLDADIAAAIEKAAGEVADGRLDAEFILDIFQTGSGTSTNTNANEVIARRASELLDGARVHPNDHVNLGQSSNDVIPTTIHVAALSEIESRLEPALRLLQSDLQAKSRELWPVIKTGRTHLQDATPIRLGQEFLGYAGQVSAGLKRLHAAKEDLRELAIGGTAVGTGLNTHPQFGARMATALSQFTGLDLIETPNHFQAQSTLDGVVSASGVLRSIAVSLGKIANDIRWLGSGPRAGLGELSLPETQPGSSIMPGKVNPVIAESLLQVVAQVIGNDTTIALAGQGSFFELNLMMPVAAYNLLQSIELLAASAENFSRRCVQDLSATERGPAMVEQGLMMGTALSPAIGYDAAARIAKEAAKRGITIREVARKLTELSEPELDRLLDPSRMAEPDLGAQ